MAWWKEHLPVPWHQIILWLKEGCYKQKKAQNPPEGSIPLVHLQFFFIYWYLPSLFNSRHRQCARFTSVRVLMYNSEDCHYSKVLSVFTFIFFGFGIHSSIYSRCCCCCSCVSCGFQVFKQFISWWKYTIAGYTVDGNFILQWEKKTSKCFTFILNLSSVQHTNFLHTVSPWQWSRNKLFVPIINILFLIND